MYKLYSIPASCSTGIHILLKVLNQEVEVININDIENFEGINPLKAVPVLDDDGFIVREGAAIALYLLEKHNSDMLPAEAKARAEFLQKLLFNYATMHPAYGRLFFAMKNLQGEAQLEAYQAAAQAISNLWKVVDKQLESNRFVSGDQITLVDYLLCIYANWGVNFDVEIHLGEHVERMIKEVSQLPEFRQAFAAEGVEYRLFA